jgi:2-methylcitrate dehydratase PrpD
MDIASEFVDYAIGLKFDDLPAEVVDCAKKLVLDTLGVMIAGSSASGIGTLVDIIRDWGGKPESSILISGDKIPTPHAVLVNAAMARAHDFDAVHEKAIVHIAAPIVPACLAIAERVGRINGKDFITAVVLGMEIMARLGLSLETSFLVTGFQITNHIGTFGTAVAAGKLLRSDQREMIHALGIAYGQVAGTLQATVEGSMMVRIQQGFAAQTGILSAILAKRGIDGPQEVFQGKFGYFPVFHQNRYDPSILTRDLGEQFETTNVSIKYFPSCFLNHSAISAMLQLGKEERIDPQEVDQIQVRVNQGAYNIVCHPLESKRNPSSNREALFSLPYTVAAALVRGHVSIEDFKEEAIQDKEVRSIANKITPIVDEAIEKRHGRDIGPAVVEVTLKNGKKSSCRVDLVKGHPQGSLSKGRQYLLSSPPGAYHCCI